MRRFIPLNCRTTRVPNAGECPDCLTPLTGASSYEGATPSPGDFSVCAYCGCLLRYDDMLALRRMSEEEMDELDPVNRKKLMDYHQMARTARNALTKPDGPSVVIGAIPRE